jgi:hypothetical protein
MKNKRKKIISLSIIFTLLIMVILMEMKRLVPGPGIIPSISNTNPLESGGKTREGKNIEVARSNAIDFRLRRDNKTRSKVSIEPNEVPREYDRTGWSEDDRSRVKAEYNGNPPEFTTGSPSVVNDFLNVWDDESFKKAWLDLQSSLNETHVLSLISIYASEINNETRNNILSFFVHAQTENSDTEESEYIEEIISEELAREDSEFAAHIYAVIDQLQLFQMYAD